MFSEDCMAARRRLDPIGITPLLIKALSPLLDVTVAGSQTFGAGVDSTATSSFRHEELVNFRTALEDWGNDCVFCRHRVNGLAAF